MNLKSSWSNRCFFWGATLGLVGCFEKSEQLPNFPTESGVVNQPSAAPPQSEPSDTEPTSPEDVEAARLSNYASDFGEDYTYEWRTFGENTNHTLAVYRVTRGESLQINAPDRLLTRVAFFWNNETTATQVIEFSSAYTYEWWWQNNVYTVSYEIVTGDFSTRQYSFELNSQSTDIQTIWQGVEGISDAVEREHGCRFNRAVLRFAWENLQRRVGDGSCWTLIDQALQQADAHDAVYYRFGSLLTSAYAGQVVDLSDVLAGDIIQFDQAVFQSSNGVTLEAGYPNHTAIIRSIGSNNQITVYEQNSPVGQATKIGTYALNDLHSGGFYIYRPCPSQYSSNVGYCSNPSTQLYAYEDVYSTSHQGSVLETVAADIQQGGVEACQRVCDDISSCVGFTLQGTTCSLREQGATTSQTGVKWYEKVE